MHFGANLKSSCTVKLLSGIVYHIHKEQEESNLAYYLNTFKYQHCKYRYNPLCYLVAFAHKILLLGFPQISS